MYLKTITFILYVEKTSQGSKASGFWPLLAFNLKMVLEVSSAAEHKCKIPAFDIVVAAWLC